MSCFFASLRNTISLSRIASLSIPLISFSVLASSTPASDVDFTSIQREQSLFLLTSNIPALVLCCYKAMHFFAKFRSAKVGSDVVTSRRTELPKLEPYKHIPTHAARDARSQVPPGSREWDHGAIAEHNKRRRQVPETCAPASKANDRSVANNWPVGQRDIPYVSKEKLPRVSQRPTKALTELNKISVQRKSKASRRAAHVETDADLTYHLDLLPSPLARCMPLSASGPDLPSVTLPTRISLPLLEGCKDTCAESYAVEVPEFDTSGPTSRLNSSSGSTASTRTKSFVSSTSSQEPLEPTPPRSRARDSLAYTVTQDTRFHRPNSKPAKRMRAATHDLTGLEQVMASPDSFQPQRAPPVIACPIMPTAGFDFGTERPYSATRLRPWLVNKKLSTIQYTNRLSAA